MELSRAFVRVFGHGFFRLDAKTWKADIEGVDGQSGCRIFSLTSVWYVKGRLSSGSYLMMEPSLLYTIKLQLFLVSRCNLS